MKPLGRSAARSLASRPDGRIPSPSWLRAWGVLAALLPAVCAAGTNLIRNAGFEQGPGSQPGIGLYWETNDAQPHPETNVLSSDVRHGGERAQWLKAGSQWDLGAVRQVSAYNSVIAGRTYVAQAWIRTTHVANPAGWYVFGIWWFQGDTWLGDSKMPRQETNNYDWRLISWTAVAPPGADRVAAFLTRHTDGDAWYDDVLVAEVSPGAPWIACEPESCSRRTTMGNNLPDERFVVRNTRGGVLNFRVSSDVSWLTVVPDFGASTGEAADGTARYAVGGLPGGIHTGTLTVVDPVAMNSPQAIRVIVTVAVSGDFDQDGDVDQEDFGAFQACYTGSGIPPADPACGAARLDGDGDVDLDDFLLWQSNMTGPRGP